MSSADEPRSLTAVRTELRELLADMKALIDAEAHGAEFDQAYKAARIRAKAVAAEYARLLDEGC